MIAKVVLNNREQNIDKVLDYSVPQQFEAAMQPGIRVAVPIGYRDRIVEGMVIGTAEESEYENLKELYNLSALRGLSSCACGSAANTSVRFIRR